MSAKRKIAIGLGIAGGAVLLAWLFSGDRRKRTVGYLSKKATDLRRAADKVRSDSTVDQHYI